MDKIIVYSAILILCSVQVSTQRQFSMKTDRGETLIHELQIEPLRDIDYIFGNATLILNRKCFADMFTGNFTHICCESAYRKFTIAEIKGKSYIEECVSDQLVTIIESNKSENPGLNGLFRLISLLTSLFNSDEIKNLVAKVQQDLNACFGIIRKSAQFSVNDTIDNYHSCIASRRAGI